MECQIREATSSDADRLSLIGSATFLETFADMLAGSSIVAHCRSQHAQAIYESYLGGGARGWIAEAVSTGAPIGYALLAETDLPGSRAAGDIELKRIYVLSRFHTLGIGGRLMQTASGGAVSGGAQRLLLAVYHGNDPAIRFYRRHGFEQIATRRFHIGDRDYDDIVLAKSLTA